MTSGRRSLIGVLACTGACSDPTAPVRLDANARRLITGEQVACALTNVGKVYCWGLNSSYWEYGAPVTTIAGSGTPAPAEAPKIASFASGVGLHFCGITTDREAVCWGRGTFGQLGGGSVGDVGNAAAVVQGNIRWTNLAVSRLTTCGRSESGIGYCWGSNQSGEVGAANVPLNAMTSAPSVVDGGYTFRSIVAGWLHACGISTAGPTYCWGNNTNGQLGIGVSDTLKRRAPVMVAGGLSFKQLSLGSRYSCGLTADSLAYCWGENATGQLGDGTRMRQPSPTLVAGGLKFTQIAASSGFGTGSFAVVPQPVQGGIGHTCALATNKRPYCWGWNANGQLGDGTVVDRLTPVAVTDNLELTTISLGGAYTCGMNLDFVWCWGSNINGQIGKGDAVFPALTPRPVLPPFGTP